MLLETGPTGSNSGKMGCLNRNRSLVCVSSLWGQFSSPKGHRSEVSDERYDCMIR